jgi:hypothetical protein
MAGDTGALPTEAEWQRAAEIGERAATVALQEATQAADGPLADIAVAFGMIVRIGQFLQAASADASVAEQGAVAYLRGAVRGMEGPANEDGTPYVGATDGH